MEKKRIYIAGPVSGVGADEVRMRFRAAELRLAGAGYEVVNPVRLCSSSWSWGECMRVCIARLIECDAIYMLRGWRGSKGARLEHFIALKLGMEVKIER